MTCGSGFARWRLVRAGLVAAICATLVIAVATPARAGLPYDWYFTEHAIDATSVRLCWGGESASTYDSWSVRRAAGTTPPPADATPEATVVGDQYGACYTATGLATDEPYTFTVTGHGPGGDGQPAAHTLAARTAGTFVLNGGAREKFPWDSDFLQLAVTAKDRRWHAVFSYYTKTLGGTFYSTRGKAGWAKPTFVSSAAFPVVASNAARVAVAWNDWLARFRPRYRLKTSQSSGFTARRTVPLGSGYSRVGDAALDRRGHLHLLAERWTTSGVWYWSNGSGKWRQQGIPKAGGGDQLGGPFYSHDVYPPLLTYDRASDRIVVLAQFKTVRIATKRASAKQLGAFQALTGVNKHHLHATGLTSRGNRITLGLESKVAPYFPSEDSGPLYVATNSHLARVPGTSANDWGIRVAASSRDRVVLAWTRRSATWDRHQQGIWTAESVRNKKTGAWSIRNIRHRTDSHYDTLTSLTVTATGQPLIASTRAAFTG